MVKRIQQVFGEGALSYTMVVFTQGEKLKGREIEDFISKAGKALKQLMKTSWESYHVFNNEDMSNCRQVMELLDKIEKMVEKNDMALKL